MYCITELHAESELIASTYLHLARIKEIIGLLRISINHTGRLILVEQYPTSTPPRKTVYRLLRQLQGLHSTGLRRWSSNPNREVDVNYMMCGEAILSKYDQAADIAFLQRVIGKMLQDVLLDEDRTRLGQIHELCEPRHLHTIDEIVSLAFSNLVEVKIFDRELEMDYFSAMGHWIRAQGDDKMGALLEDSKTTDISSNITLHPRAIQFDHPLATYSGSKITSLLFSLDDTSQNGDETSPQKIVDDTTSNRTDGGGLTRENVRLGQLFSVIFRTQAGLARSPKTTSKPDDAPAPSIGDTVNTLGNDSITQGNDSITQMFEHLRDVLYNDKNYAILDSSVFDMVTKTRSFPHNLYSLFWPKLLRLRGIPSQQHNSYPSKIWRYSDEETCKIHFPELCHQLDQDIPRCHQYLPEMRSKQISSLLRQIIIALLAEDTGENLTYWQGLDSICATFLFAYQGDAELALASASAICSSPCYLKGIFTKDNRSVLHYWYETLYELLVFHDPVLARHLASISVWPDLFCIPWFLTLFSHVFPLEHVTRIWSAAFSSQNSKYFQMFAVCTLVQVRTVLLSLHDTAEIAGFLSKLPLAPESLVNTALALTRAIIRLTPDGCCLPPPIRASPFWMTESSNRPYEQFPISRMLLKSLLAVDMMGKALVVDTRPMILFDMLRLVDSVHAQFPSDTLPVGEHSSSSEEKLKSGGTNSSSTTDAAEAKIARNVQILRLERNKQLIAVIAESNESSIRFAQMLAFHKVPFVIAVLTNQSEIETESQSEFFLRGSTSTIDPS